MQKLLTYCKEHGLRSTIALRTILSVLSKSSLPLSLQELEVDEEVREVCDRATIFRTLQRLESIGLLRRLNFSHSGAKFSLGIGGEHKEYLICRNCGDVRVLEVSCPVHQLEKELSKDLGYAEMTHELTFYGQCKQCQ